MKWINAEQQVTVTIYDEEHEECLDRIMTVEEMLDAYTNEGCPTIYSNPEQTEWIPVSERLPNLDDYTGSQVWQKEVLITGYLWFDAKKELFVSETFAKDVVCNCVPDTVVIAWMPLPKPYKVESGEV